MVGSYLLVLINFAKFAPIAIYLSSLITVYQIFGPYLSHKSIKFLLSITLTFCIEKYNINGKEVVSFSPSYINEDEMIFGNSIFKFLAYCKNYSRISLNKVRKSFIEQCEWLKNNESVFAPHSGKDENGNTVFPDFGEWFDNNINDLITQT